MNAKLHGLTLTAPWSILCVAPVLDLAPLRVVALDRDVVLGEPLKKHETRGYRLTGTPRPLLIHTGKGDAGMRDVITKLGGGVRRFVDPFASALRACGYSDLDPWQVHYEEKVLSKEWGSGQVIKLGCVTGLVKVSHIISTTDAMFPSSQFSQGPAHSADHALGNWGPRRFAWRMTEPWLAPRPFHVRGMQSVWQVPEYIQYLLRDQGAAI